MQIYIYIYVLYTFYTKLECVHVTYIHVYLFTDVEEVNIVWCCGHSSQLDRCPATSALPWGRRVATWWTKSVPSGCLKTQKNRSFVANPHKDEYFQFQLAMEELCVNIEFLGEVGLLSRKNSSFNHVTISPTTSSRQQTPTKKMPKAWQHHPPIGFLCWCRGVQKLKDPILLGLRNQTHWPQISAGNQGNFVGCFFWDERHFFEKHGENGSETTYKWGKVMWILKLYIYIYIGPVY